MQLATLTHFDSRMGFIAGHGRVCAQLLAINKDSTIVLEGLIEDPTGHVFLPNQRKPNPA
jgi:hypothetical protein